MASHYSRQCDKPLTFDERLEWIRTATSEAATAACTFTRVAKNGKQWLFEGWIDEPDAPWDCPNPEFDKVV